MHIEKIRLNQLSEGLSSFLVVIISGIWNTPSCPEDLFLKNLCHVFIEALIITDSKSTALLKRTLQSFILCHIFKSCIKDIDSIE